MATAPFWKKANYAEALQYIRARRAAQAKVKQAASLITARSKLSNASSPLKKSLPKILSVIQTKKTGMSMPDREIAAREIRAPQVMPDRVVPYTPPVTKVVVPPIRRPQVMPDRIDHPIPPKPVVAPPPAVPVKRPQGDPQITVAPGIQTGKEVFVDANTLQLTNNPTEIKLYNYNGSIIPAYQDEGGVFRLSDEDAALGLKLSNMRPAVYTPDMVDILNNVFIEGALPPISFDQGSVENAPLYYDPITNRITSSTVTQFPIYWSLDGKEMTNEEWSLDRATYTYKHNRPMVLDQSALGFIQEMLSASKIVYDSSEILRLAGNPASPNQVRGGGNITMEDLDNMAAVQSSPMAQPVETFAVGSRMTEPGVAGAGGLGEPPEIEVIATTRLSQTSTLPPGFGEWIDSSPFFKVVTWSPFKRQREYNMDALKWIASKAMYVFSWTSLYPKGTLFSNENTMQRQSGFGDLVPSAATLGLLGMIGAPLAVTSFVLSPIAGLTKKGRGRKWRDFSRSVLKAAQEKMAVLDRQFSEVLLTIGEGPGINNSPTQRLAGVFGGAAEKTRQTLYQLLPEDDHILAIEAESAGYWNTELQEYVDKLNYQNTWGMELKGLAQGKYASGLTQEAIDYYTEGLYRQLVNGHDWAADHNFIKNGYDPKYAPLQGGSSAFYAEDIPVSIDEFNFLRDLVVYNWVKIEGRTVIWQTGWNYMFLRQVAEKSLSMGRDMTFSEMATLARQFVVENQNLSTDQVRQFIKNRSYENHNRAIELVNLAEAYRVEATSLTKTDPARAQELYALSTSFFNEGLDLLEVTYLLDRKSNKVDPFSSFTWDAYPDREREFYRNLSQVEARLKRPPTRQEIIDVSYASVDWLYEVGGEAIVDISNFIPVVGPMKLVGKPILKGIGKGGETLLSKFKIGRSFIGALDGAATEIADNIFAKHIRGRAFVSVSHKQAQAASEMLAHILLSKPKTKEQFLARVGQLASDIQRIKAAATREEALLLSARAVDPGIKGISDDTIKRALEVADTIAPDRWEAVADDMWEKQVEFFLERAQKDVDKIFKTAPRSTDLEDIKVNNVRARLNNDMFSNMGRNRLAGEFGDAFRRAYLEEHKAWTGSVILSDTWWGKLGGADLPIEKVTPEMLKIRKAIDAIHSVNRWFMGAWVWAVLARRPAWMLFNYIDNTFRFLVSGEAGSTLKDLQQLLKSEVGTEVLKELGTIPSEISSSLSSAAFRTMTEQTSAGQRIVHLESILEFRDNPLGFFQHYRSNYKALTDGRGWAMHAYSLWRAFPMSVKSLAQTIEFGSRLRLYYKLYTQNMAKIAAAHVLDNLLVGLSDKLVAAGMDEAGAALAVDYVKEMWTASGASAQRFAEALSNLSTTARRADVVFVPSELWNLDWMDEATMRPLISAAANELQKFVTELVGKNIKRLDKRHTDMFFDRIIHVFDAEAEARLKTIFTKQRQIAEVFGSNMSDAFSNLRGAPRNIDITPVTPGTLTEEGEEVVRQVPKDATKLSVKNKKKAVKALTDNGITFDVNDDASILRGIELLRQKRVDLENTKPKPLTDEQIAALEEAHGDLSKSGKPATNAEVNAFLDKVDETYKRGWRRIPAGKREAHVEDLMSDWLSTDLAGSSTYKGLTDGERLYLRTLATSIREHTSNFAARIRMYWIEVYPGPHRVDASGKIIRTQRTGALWDMFDDKATNLYTNLEAYYSRMLDDLKTGRWPIGTVPTKKEILDMADIQLDFAPDGSLSGLRMFDHAEQKWVTATNPANIQKFADLTDIHNVGDYASAVATPSLGDLQTLAKQVGTSTMKINAKIVPQPFETLAEMEARSARLRLAIKEGRKRDANLILAAEFRYPMYYNFKGAIVPTDEVLLRMVRKFANDTTIKTLDDVAPDLVYGALLHHEQLNSGVRIADIIKNLGEDMPRVMENMFGWREAGGKAAFELYDAIQQALANTYGRSKEAQWLKTYYGFYAQGQPLDPVLVRTMDGRLIAYSRLIDVVDNQLSDGLKGTEVLAKLRELGFSDKEMEWSGLLKHLQDAGSRRVLRRTLKNWIQARERLLTAKMGREGLIEFKLLDTTGKELAKVSADQVMTEGNVFQLVLRKVDGDLDEMGLKRLKRWAGENRFDELVALDNSVTNLAEFADAVSFMTLTGAVGSTTYIEQIMKEVSAVVKAFSNANPTTSVHELFHSVVPWIPQEHQDILYQFARKSLGEMKVANSPDYIRWYAKYETEGVISRVSLEEFLARSFEKYIVTSVAPNSTLERIFKSMRNFMVNVYRSMKGYFGGIYLTPEVRKIFDQLVTDGWKKERAAAVRKPRTPKPGGEVTVTSKKVKPKKIPTEPEDIVMDFLGSDDMDRAGRRWMRNGNLYPLHSMVKIQGEGQSAKNILDYEAMMFDRKLVINPKIDPSTVPASETQWVTGSSEVAWKDMLQGEVPLAEAQLYKNFRIIAESKEDGIMLIQHVDEPYETLGQDVLFSDLNTYQSMTDILNGPPTDVQQAVLRLLDVNTRSELTENLLKFTDVMNQIDFKSSQANYKLLWNDYTPAEQEALRFLVDNYLPGEYAGLYGVPSKPLPEYNFKKKDANGDLFDYEPIHIVDLENVTDPNQFFDIIYRANSHIWEAIHNGASPTPRRMSKYMVEILRSRGFDVEYILKNMFSEWAGNLLVGGRRLPENLPPISNRNFLRFMSQSKVLDADGNWTALNHATKFKFTTFAVSDDMGYHFGDYYAALGRGRFDPDWNVHSYWLSIQNPITLEDKGTWGATSLGQLVDMGKMSNPEKHIIWNDADDADNLLKFILTRKNSSDPMTLEEATQIMEDIYLMHPALQKGNFGADELLTTWNFNQQMRVQGRPLWVEVDLSKRIRNSRFVAAFKDLGFDGIKYVNNFENKGSISYMIFDPTQAKRVDNIGTFDPHNRDTLFQMLDDRIEFSGKHVGASQFMLDVWKNSMSTLVDNVHNLYFNPTTGFYSANAMVEIPGLVNKPLTTYLIGNGYTYIAREMGQAAADRYLQVVSSAMRRSGLPVEDFFHMGDARFVVQMNSQEDLDRLLTAVNEAPPMRLSDNQGNMWEVGVNMSASSPGPSSQIETQFYAAQSASEATRAEAYKDWLLQNGHVPDLPTNWELLDDADMIDGEIATYPYIKPVTDEPLFQQLSDNQIDSFMEEIKKDPLYPNFENPQLVIDLVAEKIWGVTDSTTLDNPAFHLFVGMVKSMGQSDFWPPELLERMLNVVNMWDINEVMVRNGPYTRMYEITYGGKKRGTLNLIERPLLTDQAGLEDMANLNPHQQVEIIKPAELVGRYTGEILTLDPGSYPLRRLTQMLTTNYKIRGEGYLYIKGVDAYLNSTGFFPEINLMANEFLKGLISKGNAEGVGVVNITVNQGFTTKTHNMIMNAKIKQAPPLEWLRYFEGSKQIKETEMRYFMIRELLSKLPPQVRLTQYDLLDYLSIVDDAHINFADLAYINRVKGVTLHPSMTFADTRWPGMVPARFDKVEMFHLMPGTEPGEETLEAVYVMGGHEYNIHDDVILAKVEGTTKPAPGVATNRSYEVQVSITRRSTDIAKNNELIILPELRLFGQYDESGWMSSLKSEIGRALDDKADKLGFTVNNHRARWADYSMSRTNYREMILGYHMEHTKDYITDALINVLDPARFDLVLARLREVKKYGSSAYTRMYYSSHWSSHPESIFAHLRSAEMLTQSGKIVSVVDELQSDWLQSARGGGMDDILGEGWDKFSEKQFVLSVQRDAIDVEIKNAIYADDTLKQLGRVVGQYDSTLRKEQARLGFEPWETIDEKTPGTILTPGWWSAYYKAQRRMNNREASIRAAFNDRLIPIQTALVDMQAATTVPYNPFTDTWETMLLMKHIQYAMERGYEFVALPSPKVHVKRWSSDFTRWYRNDKWIFFLYSGTVMPEDLEELMKITDRQLVNLDSSLNPLRSKIHNNHDLIEKLTPLQRALVLSDVNIRKMPYIPGRNFEEILNDLRGTINQYDAAMRQVAERLITERSGMVTTRLSGFTRAYGKTIKNRMDKLSKAMGLEYVGKELAIDGGDPAQAMANRRIIKHTGSFPIEILNKDLRRTGKVSSFMYSSMNYDLYNEASRMDEKDLLDILFSKPADEYGVFEIDIYRITDDTKRIATTYDTPVFQDLKPSDDVFFSRAAKPDPTPEINEAWRAFVQSPIFTQGNNPASLEDFWGVLFGDPENLYRAGPKGFANLAEKLANEYAQAGLTEQAEVMRLIGGLASNFESYVHATAISLDKLVPPPLGLWRTNPAIRQWVSNMYGVGSEMEKGRRALEIWKDAFSRKVESSPIADLTLSKEVDKILTDLGAEGAKLKSEITQAVNYGGTVGGVTIPRSEGAVPKTNFVMIDYTDFSRLDNLMKDIMPFWMYPWKSIPFWIQTLAQHPELVSFYMKYLRWSRMAAVQYGATTSRGEQLPSLKGYLPLMPGLWFNPTAPLLFRYAFPRVTSIPETSEELTPLQHIAKFFLEDLSLYGFNISPVMSAILQTIYDPYYPKTNLVYEGARTIFPIEYIPPFVERWIMDKAKYVFKGKPGAIPDRFQEEVSWRDYLIEREILMSTLEEMKSVKSLVERERLATRAYKVITDPKREENELWLEARGQMEMGTYFRQMTGIFTGMYSKEFTSAQAELHALRDEVNVLRDSVNNEIQAMIFLPYMSPTDIYNTYTDRRYETPEGWIWNAYQMTRYVTDDLNNPLTGQERRDQIAKEATIDEHTRLYYEALKAAADLRDERLLDIPVGMDDLRSKVWDDYWAEVSNLDSEDGMYPLARKAYVIGYKPMEMVEEYMTGKWWRQINTSYPRYIQGEPWTQYQLRVEAWMDTLPEQAARLAPFYKMSLSYRIFEGKTNMSERMSQVDDIIKRLISQTTRDGYNAWKLSTDTPVDAIWAAYEDLYINAFYSAIRDLSGSERTLAEMQFKAAHPTEPTTEEIYDWIQNKYGVDRFEKREIEAIMEGLTFANIDEIANVDQSEMDKTGQEVWDVFSWAGPRSSENYKALLDAYVSLGGYESDLEIWWAMGGEPSRYPDPEDYYKFRNLFLEAAAKVGAHPPSEDELKQMIEAKKLNEEFLDMIDAELGGTFVEQTLHYYLSLSSAERKTWRKENKDEYAKIQRYYDLKDDYASQHPVWVPWYYPSYTAEETVTSGGGGAGGGGGGGGGRGSTEAEEAWLAMGRRSTLDAMQLFAGKLGTGGVVGRPYWPPELLAQLDPVAVQQVETAAVGKGVVSNAAKIYFKRIASNLPEYTKIIRDNLKLATRVKTP